LAVEGTQAAVPGLLDAIAKDRFLPPTSQAPYRLQWLAAMAIAARDPWPECDGWLAAQLDRADALVEDRRADAPEAGATAAGLLLRRCRQTPAEFGLAPAPDGLLVQLGLDGLRYGSPDARRQVQQWWQRESQKAQRP
jgi:hypothetical protein